MTSPPASTIPVADPRTTRRILRVLRILHAVLLLALPVYAVVAHVFIDRARGVGPTASAPVDIGLLLPVLAAVAAGVLASIPLVQRRLMPPRKRGTRPPPGAHVPDGPAFAALSRYYAASVVAWAQAESVALLGLLLGILGRRLDVVLGFGAVSLVALLVLAPRPRVVHEILAAAAETEGPAPPSERK